MTNPVPVANLKRAVCIPLYSWPVALLTLLLLAPPTAEAKVKVFLPSGQDVARYTTYQWAPIRIVTKSGILEDDPEISPLIRESVNRHLTARGYTEVSEGGELQVLTAGLNHASSQLEGFLLAWGFDVYWGYGVTAVSAVKRVNQQGVLIVSLVDTKTEKGVWAGYATRSFGRPGTIANTIEKAASRLLKKLPKKKP